MSDIDYVYGNLIKFGYIEKALNSSIFVIILEHKENYNIVYDWMEGTIEEYEGDHDYMLAITKNIINCTDANSYIDNLKQDERKTKINKLKDRLCQKTNISK